MDYYKILDVDINSSTDQIKKHYYKLAKKYHPDKTKNDILKLEKFKYLSEAYSILSNPKKRFIYDINYKYNIDLNKYNINENDYEILHDYYNKIMNMTEIKFFKLLFKSLPQKIKINILNKLNINKFKSEELINISNLKYINISSLKKECSINLFFKFEDLYYQNMKQLIVYNNEKIYYIFITYSNYKIKIKNKDHLFNLNILTNYENYKIINSNIIYDIKINLFQYYFGDDFIIKLNNKEIQIKNDLNKTIKLNFLGLKKIDGIRGDLIVNFVLDLNKHSYFDEKNKKIINDIFNIS